MSLDATSAAPTAGPPSPGYRPLRWLLPLALLHGLIFLAIVPPWQHYDEPTHFEYAWLIANSDHLPTHDQVNSEMRREVADSMHRFRFYPDSRQPDLLGPAGPPIGENQRVHPPLYYMLAALPLRLGSGLAVEQQLYMARGLGLGLYVLTIAAAWRIAAVVVPEEPLIQLAIPLLLLLTPTYADLMTAVNNDTLVNFSAAALLLGCALLIRDGPRLSSLALAVLALGVAISTKRTGVILLGPFLLTLIWALWRRPLRIGAVLGVLLGGGLALALASLELGRSDSGALLLGLRPWLAQIDRSYLRLNLDNWVHSVSDLSRAGDTYAFLLEVGFTTFWARFGWGSVRIGGWAEWAMAAICAACGVGLLAQAWRSRGQLPLWQRRTIWLFFSLTALGVLSMVARIHPLPPPGGKVYFPTGRYIFTTMPAVIWLTTLGWQGLLPRRWQPYGPIALVAIWLGLDLLAWGGAITGAFYRLP